VSEEGGVLAVTRAGLPERRLGGEEADEPLPVEESSRWLPAVEEERRGRADRERLLAA
jgi:hypothetical protein